MKISVIIPVFIKNFETLVVTQDAIASLGDVDLIIVDNASDTTAREALLEKANVYIRNPENKGYAYAVNQGLRVAKSDLVCLANNDIQPSENWQEVAKEILLMDKVYSCHFRMIDWGTPFSYGDKIFYEGKERWCTSSFFVIDRSKMSDLYYDENYGLGGYEDYDYWWQVRQRGFKTAYTTKACYQHWHSFTQNQLNQEERAKEDIRRKEYFKSKYGKYPEELYRETYPDQWRQDYWKVLNEL